jgi:hypothetical protein
VRLHIYVDHQVVELIGVADDDHNASTINQSSSSSQRVDGGGGAMGVEAVESTAISAWVRPRSLESQQVGFFSAVEDGTVELLSLDVWQLATPQHR